MSTVQTVTGAIEAEALGRTLIHEHVRFHDEGVADQWPAYYDFGAELEAAVEQVRAVQGHGAKTIVDPTAMFGGRSARFMREVAERTGIQIVACTGIYTYDYLPHYFMSRDADAIADMFVHDIEQGIQGTDARAGFLKCAADEPGVTDNIEKVHRACARASLRTGVPIMAHSRPASQTGPRQVEIFLEEGVDAAKIQIAHTGDTDDLDYIESLLEKGVWIGLDRYGLPMFLDDERRDKTTIELLRRGYADRLFISSDFATSIDWFPQEMVEQLMSSGIVNPEWSMAYPFEHVLPRLRDAGAWDDDVERQVYEDNPRRWLAG
jgi:phosphotriesterase-related protein